MAYYQIPVIISKIKTKTNKKTFVAGMAITEVNDTIVRTDNDFFLIINEFIINILLDLFFVSRYCKVFFLWFYEKKKELGKSSVEQNDGV